MDFGEILDLWERGRGAGGKNAKNIGGDDGRSARDALNSWLDANPVVDKDAGSTENRLNAAERRQRLRSQPPDARLDLHGKTGDETWQILEDFFRMAVSRKLEKVLIVHGKGNHSKNGAVLKDLCRIFIEQCPEAGESGHPGVDDGGTGATWVILK
jgi:DNA-nicking Smr family endonuclease